jgi:hypothetical protein
LKKILIIQNIENHFSNYLYDTWDNIYDCTEQNEVIDGRSDKKDLSRQVRYTRKRVTQEIDQQQ